MTVTVLIVDDHAVVRSGICQALHRFEEFEIFEASSKSEGFAQIARINPQILVVDLNLPDGSGLELVTWVRSISQQTAIVVLTFNVTDEHLLAAIKAGANAFVHKSAPLSELVSAIQHAYESPTSFTSQEIASAIERKHMKFGLSQRELQVVALLGSDLDLASLAQSLFISESTLKTHLTHIYRKLEVKNRIQATNVARKAGLL
jgi:DNA-binding NarL/FixJ family response regulator